MTKSKSSDQATHGGGKRNAEGHSSDANRVDRPGAAKADEWSRMGNAPSRVSLHSDPEDLGKADIERRSGAATRDPAEGPRKN